MRPLGSCPATAAPFAVAAAAVGELHAPTSSSGFYFLPCSKRMYGAARCSLGYYGAHGVGSSTVQ